MPSHSEMASTLISLCSMLAAELLKPMESYYSSLKHIESKSEEGTLRQEGQGTTDLQGQWHKQGPFPWAHKLCGFEHCPSLTLVPWLLCEMKTRLLYCNGPCLDTVYDRNSMNEGSRLPQHWELRKNIPLAKTQT